MCLSVVVTTFWKPTTDARPAVASNEAIRQTPIARGSRAEERPASSLEERSSTGVDDFMFFSDCVWLEPLMLEKDWGVCRHCVRGMLIVGPALVAAPSRCAFN